MPRDEMGCLPPRPESVAEWEDLLVRLEIVPRVVRNTVEDLGDAPAAIRVIGDAADREEEVGRWLEAAAGVGEPGRRRVDGRVALGADGVALRFSSLRARTFAMVQRRGLDVWLWEGPLGADGSVTVHQLLLWLSRQDATLLSALRQLAHGPAAC